MRQENRNRLATDAQRSDWLARAGLRPTRQRCTLAALLERGGPRHVTAETLHAEAQAAQVDVSLATVYNTLKAFTAAGLLQEINAEPGRVYYDTCVDDHAHFYVEDDGTVIDAPADSVAFSRLPAPPEGMAIAKVDVVVRLRKLP